MKTTKKIAVLIAILMAFAIRTQAQIVLEESYSSIEEPKFFGIVHLELTGDVYMWVNTLYPAPAAQIVLYSMDHDVWKMVYFNSFSASAVKMEYTSQNLFSVDGKVDFLLESYSSTTGLLSTYIINEDGELIFSADGFTIKHENNSSGIFNTNHGIKMLLYSNSGTVRVYDLPGVFVDISERPNNNENKASLNIFPNPTSSGMITLEYNLPNEMNAGQIILYDMVGQQVGIYEVPQKSTKTELSIPITNFSTGTYFCKLQAGNWSTTKKLTVAR